MRTSRDLLVVVTAVAVLAFSHTRPARAINPRDRHFSSASHGISVEAPPGWSLSQHIGFGDTVVLLLHPDGSRISVSAAATTARDSAALFEQNRKGLLAQKLTPSTPQPGPRGFLMVDIAAPDRSERLRQLYLVRPTPLGQQAVILTLVGRASAFDDHASALEFVATRLALEDPTPPPTAASATSKGRVVPKLELTDLAATSGGGPGGSPPFSGVPSSSPSPPASTSGRPTGTAGSTGQLRRHGG